MKKFLSVLIVLIFSLSVFGIWYPPIIPDIPDIPILWINVDSCRTIDSSGLYRLTADLSSPGSDCIVITSSNVTLDCQNHSITGSGGGTRGIKTDTSLYKDDILVKNCVISGFPIGIELLRTTNAAVYQNTVTGNAVNPSISLGQSDNSNIVGNAITNGYIYLNNSDNVNIEDNTLSTSVSGTGFWISNNSYGVLIKSNLISQSGTGIYLDSSDRARIEENDITSNISAIFVRDTSESQINDAINNELNSVKKVIVNSNGKINVFRTEITESEIESEDATGEINVFFSSEFTIRDNLCIPIENAEITVSGSRDGDFWTIYTDSLGKTGRTFLGFDLLGTNNPINISINANGFDETSFQKTFTDEWSFSIDLNKEKNESVTLNTPLNNSWTNLKEVNFSFTPNDPNTITECKYLNDETGWSQKDSFLGIPSNTAKEFTYTFSDDGTYLWKIWCKNNYSHEYWSEEYSINIDSVLPVIDFTTLTQADNSETTNSTINVEVEVTESNLNKVELELNGSIEGTLSHSTGNKYSKTVSLNSGINQFKVKAIDLAGNTASTSIRKVTLINESTESSTETATETPADNSEEIQENQENTETNTETTEQNNSVQEQSQQPSTENNESTAEGNILNVETETQQDNSFLLFLGGLIGLILIAGGAFILIKKMNLMPVKKTEEKKTKTNKIAEEKD
ncbi:MAG: right-handed parallel beta-helix repeat-containing protein [Candidatus Diapherotrites archaeon]|nr:right-handed parallel beta-helix repeat-containing protein [Candidatus Diapherotrites archaeon]